MCNVSVWQPSHLKMFGFGAFFVCLFGFSNFGTVKKLHISLKYNVHTEKCTF